jgi:hypothetical protein
MKGWRNGGADGKQKGSNESDNGRQRNIENDRVCFWVRVTVFVT